MSNKSTLKKSKTNFEKLHSMTDDEIDFSDLPETTPEMWKNGFIRQGSKFPAKNQQETLEIDRDIIEFFKAQEKNYQTKINELLRAYMQSHQPK